MKQLLIGMGIVVGVIALIGLMVMGTYNSFVTQEQAVDAQWSQVENVYQRRADLIPNLVNSVKGIMSQEKEVFGAIAEARTKYGGASTTNEKVAAANQLDSVLSRLLVIMENYPQLRSSEAVSSLMTELAGTENRISVERRRYNEVARDYNTAIKKFPASALAGMFGKTAKPYFQAEAGAEKPPVVDFGK